MAFLNLHYFKNFIRHYCTSTFIDVLHSPFVFDLYEGCIKKQKNEPPVFNEIETLRKQLLQNNNSITFIDFGASAKLKGTAKKVKVKTLARRHLKPPRIARILFYITQNYPHLNIVELGTSLGITTSYLATGAQNHINARLQTIEGSSEVFSIAAKVFKELTLGSAIKSHLGNFDEVLPDIINEIPSLDLLFVDGNHTYEATMKYFNMCLPKIHNSSLFIFDDIYWSKEMTAAWEEIKTHPEVRVTVDLFFIGLVFFRKEQVRQDFKLRVL